MQNRYFEVFWFKLLGFLTKFIVNNTFLKIKEKNKIFYYNNLVAGTTNVQFYLQKLWK